MAYAVTLSLRRNLKQLREFSDQIYCPETYITCLDQLLGSIENFFYVQDIFPDGESLEEKITNALWRAEDIVESYILRKISSSESESSSNIISHAYQISQYLLEAMKEIECIKEEMDKHADDFFNGKVLQVVEDKAFSLVTSSRIDWSQRKNKMVGLEEELEDIKSRILREDRLDLGAALIYGMGGIGKTSLTRMFYENSEVRDHFSIGAWTTISLYPTIIDILRSVVDTVEVFGKQGRAKKINCGQESDEGVMELVNILAGKRYLIIVDCLCDLDIKCLRYIREIFPNSRNGSRIIFLSRTIWVDPDKFLFCDFRKHFLDAPQSWNLLREEVFGRGQECPRDLERIGRKIAENCQGLPLAITTVGRHLVKKPKTEGVLERSSRR